MMPFQKPKIQPIPSQEPEIQTIPETKTIRKPDFGSAMFPRPRPEFLPPPDDEKEISEEQGRRKWQKKPDEEQLQKLGKGGV